MANKFKLRGIREICVRQYDADDDNDDNGRNKDSHRGKDVSYIY